jgi:hypothetical protein
MSILEIAWYWFGLVGFAAHLRPVWRRIKKRREIPQLNTDSEYMQEFYSRKELQVKEDTCQPSS